MNDMNNLYSQILSTLKKLKSNGMFNEMSLLLSKYPQLNLPLTSDILGIKNSIYCINSPINKSSVLEDTLSELRIAILLTQIFIAKYIAYQYGSTFSSYGATVIYIDSVLLANDFSEYQKLVNFVFDGIDAAFFFNNTGLLLYENDGRNFWDIIDIPLYNVIVDHPMFFADTLNNPPKRLTLLCADNAHVKYAKKVYPNLLNSSVLHTGGISPVYSTIDNKRDIDVLFVGSYKDLNGYTISDFDYLLINYLMRHTDCPFEQAVYNLLQTELEIDNPLDINLWKSTTENSRNIEIKVCSSYRLGIIEKLLQEGINVTICGANWEQTPITHYNNATIIAQGSMEEGLELMGRAKILLNHLAWFKYGSSERLFNAMAMGAVCVTDSNNYLNQFLYNEQNAIIYSIDNYDKDMTWIENIKKVLSDDSLRKKYIKEGFITSAEHTWEKHIIKEFLF